MKTRFVLLGALAAMLPLSFPAHAQGRPKAHPTAAVYECSLCHHKASTAQAKKLHYVCPADGGKLVRIQTASLRKPR